MIRSNAGAVIGLLITKVKSLEPGGALYSDVMREAATTQLGTEIQRVFVNGKASDGSAIGSYSTKPIYVNPDRSPKKFPVKGKTGRTTFESTGQPHKTRYFDDGYKGFRDKIGRPTNTVNLSLYGQLQNQLDVIPTSNSWGLGWQNDEMPKRAKALELKYGKKIFAPTDDEKKELISITQKAVIRALNG